MDDVLLDTLARTLAESTGAAWDVSEAGREYWRILIEALLAVTGDDGVPLLSLASDWEQCGWGIFEEGVTAWRHVNEGPPSGKDFSARCVPVFVRSSVTGTEER